MGTSSILTPLTSTSSTPSIYYQNMRINFSEDYSSWLNSSSESPVRPAGLVMSVFTMTFGAISNLTALGILLKSRIRFRRQSKAPFLLLTMALLLVDLGGHLIPGAFALYLHMNQRSKVHPEKPTKEFCQIFGASMVFFGLCPLLLGCSMAVERCVAITQPFFHAAMITLAHMVPVVFFLLSLALLLAVLPLFAVGTYTTQSPGTWCFLPIHGLRTTADTNLVLIFSCLGLSALALSLLCNILTGLALLKARIKAHSDNTNPTSQRTRSSSSASSSTLLCSLDLEMMVQLAVIIVVSCVCWSPFLIQILVMQFNQSPMTSVHESDRFILLGLRMASWNQILDPWVYILLRRAVLFRVCCASQRPVIPENSSYTETNRQAFNQQ